jgi:hypothetical protein
MHNLEPFITGAIYIQAKKTRNHFSMGRCIFGAEIVHSIQLLYPSAMGYFGSRTLYLKVLLADYEEKMY